MTNLIIHQLMKLRKKNTDVNVFHIQGQNVKCLLLNKGQLVGKEKGANQTSLETAGG